jgi:hypothetical protein
MARALEQWTSLQVDRQQAKPQQHAAKVQALMVRFKPHLSDDEGGDDEGDTEVSAQAV